MHAETDAIKFIFIKQAVGNIRTNQPYLLTSEGGGEDGKWEGWGVVRCHVHFQ